MPIFAKSNNAASEEQNIVLPLLLSIFGHLLLVFVIIYSPITKTDTAYIPGVIDVQIVDLALPESVGSQSSPSEPVALPIEEKEPEEQLTTLSPKPEAADQPEVSIASEQPKKKTALKYKTMKSKEVLKSALQQLEKKVEEQPARQLEDTIKRLQDKVSKQGKPSSSTNTQNQGEGEGQSEGVSDELKKTGVFGTGSEKEAELIDIYRTEVAFSIQKNWAYSEQLAGGGQDLEVLVVIKVMPNGEITDIFFTDRSGNAYLDDSAYKAIKKSSPVKPHPDGLQRSYVEMGLRFTPAGVQ